MKIMKRKSLIVAVISSLIVFLVPILTLVGYFAYLEIRENRVKGVYHDLLQKTNARWYGRFLRLSKVEATIGGTGALKGKAIITGSVINGGARKLSDVVLKARFLDKDDASIYEFTFRPHEPALGPAQINYMPYLTGQPNAGFEPGEEIVYKKVIVAPPPEILAGLKAGKGFAKGTGRWSGKIACEVYAVDF